MQIFLFHRSHPREYAHVLAFLFAIDEINKDPDILPNITLGYHIYDSCGNVNKVIKDVLQILSGHTVTAPNYSCMENYTVVGFIGDFRSVTTLPMAQLLSLYGYTQVRDNIILQEASQPNMLPLLIDESQCPVTQHGVKSFFFTILDQNTSYRPEWSL